MSFIDRKFRWSPVAPPTPVGENPEGWHNSPAGMLKMSGDLLWMTYCMKNGKDERLSKWDVPQQVTLKAGDMYTSLADELPFEKPLDMTDDDWRAYLRKQARTLTLKHNSIFDIGKGIVNEPLESHINTFLDMSEA
jgi:hypothetical protein